MSLCYPSMEGTVRIRLTCSSVRVHGLLGQEAVSLTQPSPHLVGWLHATSWLCDASSRPRFRSQRRPLSPTATHVNKRQAKTVAYSNLSEDVLSAIRLDAGISGNVSGVTLPVRRTAQRCCGWVANQTRAPLMATT